MDYEGKNVTAAGDILAQIIHREILLFTPVIISLIDTSFILLKSAVDWDVPVDSEFNFGYLVPILASVSIYLTIYL